MERAMKGDEFVALGVKLSELDRRFDRLRTRIPEINALGSLARSDGRQLLRQRNQARIVKIRARHVNQFSGLLLNRGHHFRMAMTGSNNGDARGKIEEAVAVHVFHRSTTPALRHQRIIARVGRRENLMVLLDELLRLGPRQRRYQVG